MRDPAWYRQGVEPDYRFTLANERTFLAWVRTALALLAGAVAVVHFLPPAALAGARTALAVALAAAASVIPPVAYRRWARVQRAMRLGDDLPFTPSLALVAVLLGILGGGVLALAIAS